MSDLTDPVLIDADFSTWGRATQKTRAEITYGSHANQGNDLDGTAQKAIAKVELARDAAELRVAQSSLAPFELEAHPYHSAEIIHVDPRRTSRSSFGLAGKSLGFRATKRAIDIAGAGIGLILLAPLLLGCAAAIKATSKGPVFFRQERYGLNSEMFRIFKFRTMYTDMGDRTGVQQTVQGDPRITRVGAFLRKTSFDELPQLLNVLDGSMSLVGPRPHVPNMLAAGVRYEDFDPRYLSRHAMVPGITGLAQVNGFRGETQTHEAAQGRIDKDIEYCEKATIKTDIKILFKTIRCEFLSGSGF
ncbi:sugar transferase [Salipiger bermudensis]|uniref:sugar transferase n=1 Tax=Salipiger bermudensis TaxID=344736 RepID=UPI0021BD61A1|nr:sugar transferase [Salipiger bermudensis]